MSNTNKPSLPIWEVKIRAKGGAEIYDQYGKLLLVTLSDVACKIVNAHNLSIREYHDGQDKQS